MYSPFSSGQSLDRLGRRGDVKDDSTEILFQSFVQEVLFGNLSIQLSSADHGVAYPPMCPGGWFWRGYRGV